jgi:predicted acylesterase/phospholipase RssA
MAEVTRPKIGLALSGASSRSVFYIGFLEVLQENSIPIDYIAACSGATIVSASYACETLPQLKEFLFNLDTDLIFSLVDRRNARGGIYNLDKVEEVYRRFTKNCNFEDVRPLMGFVAVDIDKGEQVVLSMGDMAHAARISCTVPGIFEPVQWGSRTLVDGGLLSIVPCDVVREAGMDIVIGINIRTTEHIFLPYQVWIRHAMNMLKKVFLVSYAEKLWQTMARTIEQMDIFEYFDRVEVDTVDLSNRPGMFSVLGKSIDLAIAAQNNSSKYDVLNDCDILIRQEMERGKKSYEISSMKDTYLTGRSVAMNYLPEIRSKIQNFEKSL